MRRTLVLLLSLTATPVAAHPSVSIVFDSRGNLYYSDLKQVWRIAPDGSRAVAVPGVHTHELAIDAQDNLYGEHLWYEGEKIDKWGHYVWRRAPDGKISLVMPRREGFLRNYAFVRDRAGNMYWAERERNEIRKRAPNGTITTVARGFTNVRWMTAAPDGTLFLIDTPALVRITSDGRVTKLVEDIVNATPLLPKSMARHDVQGLWTDGAGNVYVAHTDDRVVLRVTPRGVASVIAKSPVPWRPTGGAVGRDGGLWVLEVGVGNAMRVRKVGGQRAEGGGQKK